MDWTYRLRRARVGRLLALMIASAGSFACTAHPGTTVLNADERTALALACPEGSRECRDRHLSDLASVPRPLQLARLTVDESLRLIGSCADAQTLGPAEFRRCQARELSGGRSDAALTDNVAVPGEPRPEPAAPAPVPERAGLVSPPSRSSDRPVVEPDARVEDAGYGYKVRRFARGVEIDDPRADMFDCGHFSSAQAAQIVFNSTGGPSRDPHNLDGDGDGFACEYDPRKDRYYRPPQPVTTTARARGSNCHYVSGHRRGRGYVKGHMRCR